MSSEDVLGRVSVQKRDSDLAADVRTAYDESLHSEATRRLPLPVVAAIALFWFITVFIWGDPFTTSGMLHPLYHLFFTGILHDQFFSIYELLVVVLSFYLLSSIGDRRVLRAPERVLMYGAAFGAVMLALHPSLPLTPQVMTALVKQVGVWGFFFYALLATPDDVFLSFLRKCFQAALFAVLVFDCWALLQWVGGGGSDFFGERATVLFGDVLLVSMICQVLAFALFLLRRKPALLATSLVLMLTLFLSFRRANFLTAVVLDAAVLGFYYVRGIAVRKNLLFILATASVALVLAPMLTSLVAGSFLNVYFLRQVSALAPFVGGLPSGGYYGDTGHTLQSILTTKYMLAHITDIWGSGILTDPRFIRYIPGQDVGGIHNGFAFVWARDGTYWLFYYLLVIGVAFAKYLKSVSTMYKHDIVHVTLCCALSLLIIGPAVTGWFSGFAWLDALQPWREKAWLIFPILMAAVLRFEVGVPVSLVWPGASRGEKRERR